MSYIKTCTRRSAAPTSIIYILVYIWDRIRLSGCSSLEVMEREKPDGILCTFGGQTALNCAVKLHQAGVFEKHQVQVLGRSEYRM